MIKCAQASLGTDSIKSLKNTNDFLGVATYELSKRAAGRDDWIYHRTSVLSPNAARASPFWLRLRRAKCYRYSAVQISPCQPLHKHLKQTVLLFSLKIGVAGEADR